MKSALDIPTLLRELDRRIDSGNDNVDVQVATGKVIVSLTEKEGVTLTSRGQALYTATGLDVPIPLSLMSRWRIGRWVWMTVRRQRAVDRQAAAARVAALINLTTTQDHAPEQTVATGV